MKSISAWNPLDSVTNCLQIEAPFSASLVIHLWPREIRWRGCLRRATRLSVGQMPQTPIQGVFTLQRYPNNLTPLEWAGVLLTGAHTG